MNNNAPFDKLLKVIRKKERQRGGNLAYKYISSGNIETAIPDPGNALPNMDRKNNEWKK